MSDFKRGIGLGAGFATGWVLMLFVVLPLVFLGGCAVLIAASTGGGSTSSKGSTAFSYHDATVLGLRAKSNVHDFYPHARPVSSACRFVRRDTVGPDSWDYTCTVRTVARGRRVAFRQRVQCFDPPPYATFSTGSCTLDGDPKRA